MHLNYCEISLHLQPSKRGLFYLIKEFNANNFTISKKRKGHNYQEE